MEIHPETAAGAAQAAGMNDAQGRGGQVVRDVDSFAAETAKAIGKDERTVRRDAERGTKVISEVIDMITGTKLDSMRAVAKLATPLRSREMRSNLSPSRLVRLLTRLWGAVVMTLPVSSAISSLFCITFILVCRNKCDTTNT
ncbi:hypothetical protein [Sinorhizobium fredii]|uniref:hypothetical protein n=1 Tax=Rhizobium fredii TaxID=380 RepID=UPI0012FD6FD1|nr:hypothetical protein [Sinorhizobium fredii]